MATTNLKFRQLVSGSNALYALEEDGSVWVYLGQTKGWKAIPMYQAEEYRHQNRSNVPESFSDDIPF